MKQHLRHIDMSQRKQDLTQVAMELQIINILLEILEQLCIYLSPTHRRMCLITVIFIFILDFYTRRNTLRFQMSCFSNWAIIDPSPLTIRCLQCTLSLLRSWCCSSLGRPVGGDYELTIACLGASCRLNQVLSPDMYFCVFLLCISETVVSLFWPHLWTSSQSFHAMFLSSPELILSWCALC